LPPFRCRRFDISSLYFATPLYVDVDAAAAAYVGHADAFRFMMIAAITLPDAISLFFIADVIFAAYFFAITLSFCIDDAATYSAAAVIA